MSLRSRTSSSHRSRMAGAVLAALALAALALAGCEREDMHNQPRHEWHEASEFFADGKAARPLVEGTVSRTALISDNPLLRPRNAEGAFVETYPFEITRGILDRGRQRYDIYCAMCHGATGTGDGMIVRRGFSRPPSFHEERLRNAAPGYVFDVITHGYGAMYSYDDRIAPDDRWKIAAYIKALQLSQRAELTSLPPSDRQQIEQAAVTQPAAQPSAAQPSAAPSPAAQPAAAAIAPVAPAPSPNKEGRP